MCKLKKALYGLKPAPRTWYDRIDKFLTILGFTKSKADSKLYYKVEKGNPVTLLLYVDDLFVILEPTVTRQRLGVPPLAVAT